MTFYNDLAFRLRMRRLSEEEVAQIMLTVRQHELDSGEDPAEAFPDVSAYADQFPRGTYRSTIDRGIALLLGAIAAFFIANTVVNLSTGDYLVPPMPLLAVSAVAFLALVVFALRRTKRLPTAFIDAADLHTGPDGAGANSTGLDGGSRSRRAGAPREGEQAFEGREDRRRTQGGGGRG